MELTDILVVEDGEQNINDAREALGEIMIARSFAEFEDIFTKNKPKYVLSDLYFPTRYNGEKHEKLKSEVADILENYINKNYGKSNPLARVLEMIFPNLNSTNFDEHLDAFNDPVLNNKNIRPYIRNAYDEGQRVKDYKKLLKDINDNVHDLPSGIFVYRKCKSENIPCIIVTNAYHHGTEFQPFVYHVGSYFDNLVNGKKQWKEALE